MSDDLWQAMRRAEALLAVHRTAEAIEVVQSALAHAPDATGLYEVLARCYLDIDDFYKARTAAAEIIRTAPTRESGYRLTALAFLEAGAPRDAEPFARRAVELAPNSANPHYALCRIEIALRELKRAKVSADRVVALMPVSGLGYHALSLVHLAAGDLEAAERECRRALSFEPDSAVYLNNLGLALMGQGQLDEATELFTTAGRQNPRQDTSRTNLVIASRRQVAWIPLWRWMRDLSPWVARRLPNLAALASIAVVYGAGALLGALPAFGRIALCTALALVGVGYLQMRRRRFAELSTPAQLLLGAEREQRRRTRFRPRRWNQQQRSRFVLVSVLCFFGLAGFIPVAYPTPAEQGPTGGGAEIESPSARVDPDTLECLRRAGLVTVEGDSGVTTTTGALATFERCVDAIKNR